MSREEKVAQAMNAAPAIPRLGIPAYEWWSEGLHGIARNGYATVFPQAIGLAATRVVEAILNDEHRVLPGVGAHAWLWTAPRDAYWSSLVRRW